MSGTPEEASKLAIHCLHLLQTAERGIAEPERMCGHPARDGRACIGPFLHDLPTDCGLWDPHPQRHSIAVPVPDRWQGRRRREGFDMRRSW